MSEPPDQTTIAGTGKPLVSYETTATGAKATILIFGCVWDVSIDSGIITSRVFMPNGANNNAP